MLSFLHVHAGYLPTSGYQPVGTCSDVSMEVNVHPTSHLQATVGLYRRLRSMLTGGKWTFPIVNLISKWDEYRDRNYDDIQLTEFTEGR